MPMAVEFVSDTAALFELLNSAMIEAGVAVALIARAAPPLPLPFSCPCKLEVKAKNEHMRMTR